MKHRIPALFLLVAVAAFGCKPMEYYQPPPSADSARTAATVVGSRTDLLGPVKGIEAWIARVDDKAAPVRSYDQSYTIAPGRHRIVISAQVGTETATAPVDYTFEAGKSYVVRGTDIRSGSSEVWLEDARTGRTVGGKFRATVK